MIEESDNQPTHWSEHILFLILLNIVGGIMSFLLMSLPSAGIFDTTSIGTSELIISSTLLGIMDGGILGYTLWASTDDFPQSRAVIITGIWGALLGGMFFTGDYIIFTGCGFPVLAYILTFIALKPGSQVASIVGATFFSIVSWFVSVWIIGKIVPDSNDIGGIATLLISLITYSTLLPYFLKSDNNRHRTQNAEREQRQQLRNTLSAGLLPEENYTVGDDGELIPVDNAQNSHKAQS